MDSRFSTELPQAFIAHADDLRHLAKLMTDRIGDLKLSADCADGITRDFSSITELLQYDNPRPKQIVRLRLEARSEDYKKTAEIDLSGSTWRGISIQIRARDDVVTRLKEAVLDRVTLMRPMYSWLHRYDFVSVALGIQIFIGLLPAILITFGAVQVSGEPKLTGKSAAQATVIGLAVPACAVGLGIVVNRFRDSLFPRAIFAIGHAEKHLKSLEKIQTTVIVGFIVSFAASVVVAIWQAWLA